MSKLKCLYGNEENCELLRDLEDELSQTIRVGNVLYDNLRLLHNTFEAAGKICINGEGLRQMRVLLEQWEGAKR